MKILIATLLLSLPLYAQTNFNLGSGTTTPSPNAPIFDPGNTAAPPSTNMGTGSTGSLDSMNGMQVQPQTDFWTGNNEATGTNFEGSDFGTGRGTGVGTGTGTSPGQIPTRPQTLPGSIMNPNGISPGWQGI